MSPWQGWVTVVTGLPRSGTSMMMNMLEAGGIPPLTDGVRPPDVDNPRGYYEYESVKEIADDPDWVVQAKGRAVKLVSALLSHLLPSHTYKVVFMQRAMPEILASQRTMLARRGESTDAVNDETMARAFERHLAKIAAWIERQPNVDALYVSYNDVVEHPEREAERVCAFLGGTLDVRAMVAVVDRDLYRNRGEGRAG